MVRALSVILILTCALHVIAPAPANGGSRSGEEEPHDDTQPAKNPARVGSGTGSDEPQGQGGNSGSPQANENEELNDVLENLSDVLQEVIKDIIDNSGSAATSDGGGNNDDASPTTSGQEQQIQTVASLQTTAIPKSLSRAAGCLSVSSVFSSCSQAGQPSCGGDFIEQSNCLMTAGGWDNQNVHDHASCLCYAATVDQSSSTSLSWAPDRFDGWVSQCQAFLSTDSAVPSSTAVFAGVEVQFTATQVEGQLATFVGLCSQAGDVRAAATTSLNTPSATPAPSTAAPQSGSSTGGAESRHGGLALGLIAFAGSIALMLPLV